MRKLENAILASMRESADNARRFIENEPQENTDYLTMVSLAIKLASNEKA